MFWCKIYAWRHLKAPLKLLQWSPIFLCSCHWQVRKNKKDMPEFWTETFVYFISIIQGGHFYPFCSKILTSRATTLCLAAFDCSFAELSAIHQFLVACYATLWPARSVGLSPLAFSAFFGVFCITAWSFGHLVFVFWSFGLLIFWPHATCKRVGLVLYFVE